MDPNFVFRAESRASALVMLIVTEAMKIPISIVMLLSERILRGTSICLSGRKMAKYICLRTSVPMHLGLAGISLLNVTYSYFGAKSEIEVDNLTASRSAASHGAVVALFVAVFGGTIFPMQWISLFLLTISFVTAQYNPCASVPILSLAARSTLLLHRLTSGLADSSLFLLTQHYKGSANGIALEMSLTALPVAAIVYARVPPERYGKTDQFWFGQAFSGTTTVSCFLQALAGVVSVHLLKRCGWMVQSFVVAGAAMAYSITKSLTNTGASLFQIMVRRFFFVFFLRF